MIMAMNDKLSLWLGKELERRGWSHRELARRAGVSQTAVSQAISEERKVGWDFCAAIAGPLDRTPVEVLRLAGLLPPEPQPAQDEDNLLDAFRRLTCEEQGFLLRLLRPQASLLQEPTEQGAIEFIPNSLSPDIEAIIEIVARLDILERRLVYDYSCWRLTEQEQRRNSSGRRRKSKKARQEELDRVMEHLDLMISLDESDPLMGQWVIDRLWKIINGLQSAEVQNTEAGPPLATQSPD